MGGGQPYFIRDVGEFLNFYLASLGVPRHHELAGSNRRLNVCEACTIFPDTFVGLI
jgi:hypothetical protein